MSGKYDYLDSLWRKAVMLKHRGRSVVSGSPATEIHHIVTRSRKNTRWDVDNGCPLTLQEHRMLHDNPSFRHIVHLKFGLKNIDNLQIKSVKYFDKNFERIKNELKEIIKKYEKEQK